jgi:hypothetical protein
MGLTERRRLCQTGAVPAKQNVDYRAGQLLADLLADRGWTPAMVEMVSRTTGHPSRQVSKRSVYRVIAEGHKPTNPVQFEIAATLGLLPSHIWGRAPLPASYQPTAVAA